MRIAVINETSAADRNADILAALDGRGHTVINAGMVKNGARPELTYLHTGLVSRCRRVSGPGRVAEVRSRSGPDTPSGAFHDARTGVGQPDSVA